jgi:hypothetical protein
MQGYASSQITILLSTAVILTPLFSLSVLTGQQFSGHRWFISSSIGRIILRNNRIAVDNFQGEENDIILLSLVRSNPQNRIGYLSEANRICVALSRAKKGLYVIGNFEQLKTKSKLWEKIVDDAIKREFLDNRLELICQRQVIAVLYHFLLPENYQRLLF